MILQNRFAACRRTRLDQIAYVNGSFVPIADAKVSVLDRGFLFADGIYEVAAVLDGKLIDNESHLARLKRSVGEIALPLPETGERIQEIQRELIARNNLVNGMVYLQVTRGADSGRGRGTGTTSIRPGPGPGWGIRRPRGANHRPLPEHRVSGADPLRGVNGAGPGATFSVSPGIGAPRAAVDPGRAAALPPTRHELVGSRHGLPVKSRSISTDKRR